MSESPLNVKLSVGCKIMGPRNLAMVNLKVFDVIDILHLNLFKVDFIPFMNDGHFEPHTLVQCLTSDTA